MGIDIIVKQVGDDDVALKELVGRTIPKTVRLIMFGTAANAQWAASRALRRASFPFREGQIAMHHTAFKSKIGDLVKITIAQYSITDLVCRVMGISFGELESEDIIFNFIEDPDYATNVYTLPEAPTYPPAIDWSVEPLTPAYVIDAPYDFVGENIKLLPLVGRKKGTEVGYDLYISHDGGSSYIFKKNYTSYCIHGELVYDITHHYPTVTDKNRYITIDLTVTSEENAINNIGRAEMFADYNQAILIDGDNYGEIFGFDTIVLDDDVDGRIHLTGLSRGKFDTLVRDWSAGTDFFFIRANAIDPMEDSSFFLGAQKYFKLVPYNHKYIDDLADASAIDYTVQGRGLAAFPVSNLRANGIGLDDIGVGPEFSSYITLTWNANLRNQGAGLGDPDVVVDDDPDSYEGLFEVLVYISDVLVRTETAIDALTWTYTTGMHNLDNSGVLADEVVFHVTNYLTSNSVKYRSEPNIITASKITGSTYTTTTTTTTTTTSSSTTTTTA
jgi:hypothetical protein